eukprot:TRINITY_DN3211_c0_g1_i1.p1 TRINITY_DN3211_c0_g1~~TRINITY_DN3211_c0_g1_i1.p1  ORF type:complete len:469 (-),score=48.48 TRINITY_DN3211_c0_g1_i1:3472-4878(-)
MSSYVLDLSELDDNNDNDDMFENTPLFLQVAPKVTPPPDTNVPDVWCQIMNFMHTDDVDVLSMVSQATRIAYITNDEYWYKPLARCRSVAVGVLITTVAKVDQIRREHKRPYSRHCWVQNIQNSATNTFFCANPEHYCDEFLDDKDLHLHFIMDANFDRESNVLKSIQSLRETPGTFPYMLYQKACHSLLCGINWYQAGGTTATLSAQIQQLTQEYWHKMQSFKTAETEIEPKAARVKQEAIAALPLKWIEKQKKLNIKNENLLSIQEHTFKKHGMTTIEEKYQTTIVKELEKVEKLRRKHHETKWQTLALLKLAEMFCNLIPRRLESLSWRINSEARLHSRELREKILKRSDDNNERFLRLRSMINTKFESHLQPMLETYLTFLKQYRAYSSEIQKFRTRFTDIETQSEEIATLVHRYEHGDAAHSEMEPLPDNVVRSKRQQSALGVVTEFGTWKRLRTLAKQKSVK